MNNLLRIGADCVEINSVAIPVAYNDKEDKGESGGLSEQVLRGAPNQCGWCKI